MQAGLKWIWAVLNGKERADDALKYSLIAYTVAFIHVFIALFFWIYGVVFLCIYNIAIVLLYTYLAAFSVKQKRFTMTFFVSFFEVLAHSVIATLVVGWDFGFMLYDIALIPVVFYLAFTLPAFKKDARFPFFWSFFVMLIYIGIRMFCEYIPPFQEISASSTVRTLVYCGNSFVSFLVLLVFSLLFSMEVAYTQKALEEENHKLDSMANFDPLTQLLNRRSMGANMQQAWESAQKKGTLFCVVIGDIDDFKLINDTYGHERGDTVLVKISSILTSLLREDDAVCRWGGEEMLLLVRANLEITRNIMERIREKIHDTSILDNGTSVTMTFGIAEYRPDLTIQQMIRLADDRMYQGKSEGKDRVVG